MWPPHPPPPGQRGARLTHGSGLPPCRRPGTEVGQPENLSGLKITPSCMCFCNFSYWKSHSETLFVKKKKAFRDQMSSLFQLLKAGSGQPMFTFLSPFREQRSINFLGPCGSKTTPALRTRSHHGGVLGLCKAAQGPHPLPSGQGPTPLSISDPPDGSDHESPLISASLIRCL